MKRRYDVGARDYSAKSDAVVVTEEGRPEEPCFEKLQLRPGLVMLLAAPARSDGFRMDVEIERAPLSLSYNLTHTVRSKLIAGVRKSLVLERRPGECALAYLPETRSLVEVGRGELVTGLSLHLSMGTFADLFDADLSGLNGLAGARDSVMGPDHFYQCRRFSAETGLVTRQIINCPFKGVIRKLYMEAKALELVSLKLQEFGKARDADGFDLNCKDMERVREAYCILHGNLDKPPGLVELGLKVGLNRNKLNQGFKRLYGDTVFNVVRSARLDKARLLLEDTGMSLSEIALAVGYSNQSNFSTAFRRQFGKTPRLARRDF